MSGEPQLYRINPESRESEKIQEVEFSQLGLQERQDIQEWVAANPGILGDDLLGRVDILPEPDESAREAEEGQVPGVQFLKAGEDPAKLLHLVDETLHQVPFPV